MLESFRPLLIRISRDWRLLVNGTMLIVPSSACMYLFVVICFDSLFCWYSLLFQYLELQSNWEWLKQRWVSRYTFILPCDRCCGLTSHLPCILSMIKHFYFKSNRRGLWEEILKVIYKKRSGDLHFNVCRCVKTKDN